MNPLTQFKKTPILAFLIALALVVVASAPPPAGAAWAEIPDFNGDGHPDYVLSEGSTRQTAIWYLNNNVFISSAYGPTLPADLGWFLVGAADFNRDGHPDYVFSNSTTGVTATAIWYLSGPTFIGSAYGPSVPSGWFFVGAADFNGDGNPDYVLGNANTRQTAIWYLNNNVFISSAYGPTPPAGWGLFVEERCCGGGKWDY